MKEDLIKKKQQEILALKDYLHLKANQRDWHGVADAAMDIRDLESEIIGINQAFTAMSLQKIDEVDLDLNKV